MFQTVPLSSGLLHCTHNSGICHTGFAVSISKICYDIYQCCVYSVELLMMDRGTVRNM